MEQADTALCVAGLPYHNIFRTELRAALAVAIELIAATTDYYQGYMVDEAEEGEEWAVCTPEQHKKAKRVKQALARIGGAA